MQRCEEISCGFGFFKALRRGGIVRQTEEAGITGIRTHAGLSKRPMTSSRHVYVGHRMGLVVLLVVLEHQDADDGEKNDADDDFRVSKNGGKFENVEFEENWSKDFLSPMDLDVDNDLAIVTFTSGTTGSWKFIRLHLSCLMKLLLSRLVVSPDFS